MKRRKNQAAADLAVRKLTDDRLSLAGLAAVTGLSRQTLANWLENPDRQRAVRVIARGALAELYDDDNEATE